MSRVINVVSLCRTKCPLLCCRSTKQTSAVLGQEASRGKKRSGAGLDFLWLWSPHQSKPDVHQSAPLQQGTSRYSGWSHKQHASCIYFDWRRKDTMTESQWGPVVFGPGSTHRMCFRQNKRALVVHMDGCPLGQNPPPMAGPGQSWIFASQSSFLLSLSLRPH